MAAIAVVLDHTTATALYDPEDPFNEDVQGSGGPGDPYASALSLTAGDAERPARSVTSKGCGSSGSRRSTPMPPSPPPNCCASGTPGPPSSRPRRLRPSPAHPTGRYLLTLTSEAYARIGVQAGHPDQ
ncbi:hypothetical protein [Streptomyces sp. NPDC058294]|uniref:hypothetical protein n=1 Tax=Streptomyces sp. NPDC058294 TaxID=3346430 RepID=UPI0036EF9B7D